MSVNGIDPSEFEAWYRKRYVSRATQRGAKFSELYATEWAIWQAGFAQADADQWLPKTVDHQIAACVWGENRKEVQNAWEILRRHLLMLQRVAIPPVVDAPPADARQEPDDLAMLVRRLAHALKKSSSERQKGEKQR